MEVHVEAPRPGCGDHLARGVDSENGCSECHEFRGKGAISATEVKNVFAGLGGEKIDYGCSECGDEAAVLGVSSCVPDLAGGVGHGLLSLSCEAQSRSLGVRLGMLEAEVAAGLGCRVGLA